MMIVEFAKLIEEDVKNIDAKDYKLIEYVYQWYPKIGSKEDIAAIYKIGGMTIINDMLERADKAYTLEERKNTLLQEIEEVKRDIKNLANISHTDEL